MTVLIWMSPEPGHILPTVKFARDLQRRNVRVVYLSVGSIAQHLEQLGFEVIRMTSFSTSEDCGECGLYADWRPARFMYQAWRRPFRSHEEYIDAFRRDFYSAILQSGANLFLVDGIFDSLLRLETAGIAGKLCRVVKLYIHLPYGEPRDDPGAPIENAIFLAPEEFELPHLRVASVHYTEASLFKREDVRLAYLEQQRMKAPLIYFSLGSQVGLYQKAAYLIGTMYDTAKLMPDCRFLLASPIDVTHCDQMPDNVTQVSSVVQWEVLKYAAVAITHGGFSTVKECIFHAVPMLLVPQLWDQPMNAFRVRHHRLGLIASAMPSAAELKAHISDLLENYAPSADLLRMSSYFRSIEEECRTAQLCLDLL